MEAILIALATAANFIFFKFKFEKERYGDVALDIASLVALSWMFGGTFGGMVVAMWAGAMISIYLYYNPPSWE